MKAKTVLISGAGIGGPTLAFWLKAGGFEPTLVEHAPALRAAGFVIDFWGLGYDLAEFMGLSTDVERVAYHLRSIKAPLLTPKRSFIATAWPAEIGRKRTGGFGDRNVEADIHAGIVLWRLSHPFPSLGDNVWWSSAPYAPPTSFALAAAQDNVEREDRKSLATRPLSGGGN